MAVTTATRTVPQQLRAVQMTPGNAAAIYALLPLLTPKYSTTTQVDAMFAPQGGTRITISRAEYPDQFAYPGDWILVTDADYQNGVWTVASTTEIQVWGISAGLPGTATDFTNKFTLGG